MTDNITNNSNRSHLSLPRGFSDKEGEWLEAENFIINSFIKRARLIDCNPIRTSPLAFSSTFTKGLHSDNEKVFEFKDRKGRDLMLTPDILPLVLRWYLESVNNKPKRLMFHSPVFRYRRQKNRLFNQIGMCFINEEIPKDGFDQDALTLAHVSSLVFTKDLKINSELHIKDFKPIYTLLERVGLNKEKSSNVLNILRPLNTQDREQWINNNLPTSKETNLFKKLIVFNKRFYSESMTFKETNDEEVFKLISPAVEFARACQLFFDNPIYLTFDNLSSSQQQDGISFEFRTLEGEKYSDGGCYSFYGSKFDQRINSFKSIGTGLEGLIRHQNAFNSQRLLRPRKILILSWGVSPLFTRKVLMKFYEEDFSVVHRSISGKIKKVLKQYALEFDFIVILGETEEKTNVLPIKNLKTYEIVYTELNSINEFFSKS